MQADTGLMLGNTMYHAVIPHWFYYVDSNNTWKPFSFTDSINLEEAYKNGMYKIQLAPFTEAINHIFLEIIFKIIFSKTRNGTLNAIANF